MHNPGMSTGADRYFAKWPAGPPASVQKSLKANTSALTYPTLLTYPMRDLAGDYVEPEGCDFAPHMLDPCIDLEHRRHPLIKGMPVAWARASLSEPGAPYSVEPTRLNFGEPDAPDWHTVPVGTEFYDKSCPVSMQVFALREQDLLPAASLEFEPVEGFRKAIGYSQLEKRSAWHFFKCRVHRWTVCERGVNPGALGLLQKSAPAPTQVPPLLDKILTDRRVNVGGTWEPLHGVIYKALAPHLPAPNRSTVCVEHKAMDDPGADLTPANDAAVGEQVPDDADGTSPTAQALLDFAQQVADAKERLLAAVATSEHKRGKKKALAAAKMAGTTAESAIAAADMVTADVSDDDAEWDDSKEPKIESDATEPDEDDDGVMKALGAPHRRRYRKAIKRFKLADLNPEPARATEPVQKAPVAETDPELSALLAENQKWRAFSSSKN